MKKPLSNKRWLSLTTLVVASLVVLGNYADPPQPAALATDEGPATDDDHKPGPGSANGIAAPATADPPQSDSPQPAPPVSLTLGVVVTGPQSGLVGTQFHFVATVTGEISSIAWDVVRLAADDGGGYLDRPDGLIVYGDRYHGTGMLAAFSSPVTGAYQITCAAAGPQGVVMAKRMFEVLAPTAQPASAVLGMQTGPPPGHAPLAQGVQIAARTLVSSGTLAAEGAIVRGSFLGVANRIKTGTFSGISAWQEAAESSRYALGQAYGAWVPFFNWLLSQPALQVPPQAAVPLLEEAANALGALQ